MTTTIEQPKTPTQTTNRSSRARGVQCSRLPREQGGGGGRSCEPGFRVTNEAAASWVVRHVVAARDRAERAKAWPLGEVAQAERDEAFFMARFGGELEDWLRSVLDTKRKVDRLARWSRGSPHVAGSPRGDGRREGARLGTLPQPSAVVAVPASEHLSRQDLILKFKQTGEIPDGADLQPASASLYIR